MRFATKLMGAAVALSMGMAVSGTAQAQTFVNVLTGGTSGVYYPLGVALSQIYGKSIAGSKTSVQATKASVENLNLLEAGKGEIGFTLGDALSQAWTGVADAGYAKPLQKLRGVAGIYPNYIQIIAANSSGIKSLADLKGKRISVGAPKSGTELNARAILAAAGLTYADFAKVEYLAFGESVDLMKNRQLDATLQSAGLGVASIKDLATSVDITVVPVPAEVVAKIGDAAYQPSLIPAGTYKGQDAPMPTAAINNFLVTHSGVSDDVAYGMTKNLFENLDGMVSAHAAAKDIKLEKALAGMPVPLHPGAEKYYREKGLVK
ncbi:C4-dicarboxylate ABC transporter [Elstera litoralis]|uniref:C4-dicarboxylate ABC transporter n=1 Tax=Elstera litoralis TaxID=552518 RepID=A0A0F3IV93_9PROT|nr:TAXI family TRAP transporter solute-binding subunit [Elstera litoralis]KJV10650.1 C4-dicarboxylate ABC transporter [Elstera litoralis]